MPILVQAPGCGRGESEHDVIAAGLEPLLGGELGRHHLGHTGADSVEIRDQAAGEEGAAGEHPVTCTTLRGNSMLSSSDSW